MKYRYRYAEIRIQIASPSPGLWLFLPLLLFLLPASFPPSLPLQHFPFLFFFNYFSFSMSICIVEFRLRAPLVPHSHPFFGLSLWLPHSASLLSTLVSCLAKNCAKNQFCLLFFCNVFLAKTNPHASPIAISLCCVSFPLPYCLRACANVRFGSLRVSFLFFFFFCFCAVLLRLPTTCPPVERLLTSSLTCPTCPSALPGVALLCLCANFIRIWTVRFYFMQKSRSTWTLLAVVVSPPLSLSFCLSLSVAAAYLQVFCTYTHTRTT